MKILLLHLEDDLNGIWQSSNKFAAYDYESNCACFKKCIDERVLSILSLFRNNIHWNDKVFLFHPKQHFHYLTSNIKQEKKSLWISSDRKGYRIRRKYFNLPHSRFSFHGRWLNIKNLLQSFLFVFRVTFWFCSSSVLQCEEVRNVIVATVTLIKIMINDKQQWKG